MERFPRNWPFVRGIHQWPVNSPHKGQWRGVLMFSLICAWINGWVNNREAGDLGSHRAHYDVIVMIQLFTWWMLTDKHLITPKGESDCILNWILFFFLQNINSINTGAQLRLHENFLHWLRPSIRCKSLFLKFSWDILALRRYERPFFGSAKSTRFYFVS